MPDFRYYINDEGLKSWKSWMAEGYLHYLRAAECAGLNTALLPALVYVGFLLASWIPGTSFNSSPITWYFGWGYLAVSVVMLTILHVRHPKRLEDEAQTMAQDGVEKMIYHARLYSEIKQLTEDEI